MTTFHDLARVSYRIDCSDEAWIDEINRVALRLFRAPTVAWLVRFDVATPDALLFSSQAAHPELLKRAVTAHASLSPALLKRAYSFGPFARMNSEQLVMLEQLNAGGMRDFLEDCRQFRQEVVPDTFGMYGGSESRGCLICVLQPERAGPRRRWAGRMVAAHLAAGLRLRSAPAEEPDAIIDARGEIAERSRGLTEQAGAAIAKAMQDYRVAADRAGEGHGALEIWKALVAGRWSLVEQTDRRGRRTLLLRRNEVVPSPLADDASQRAVQVMALAARGHSNKFIAYELGLSPSTVAFELKRTMMRLGLGTRAELVRLGGAVLPHDVAASA